MKKELRNVFFTFALIAVVSIGSSELYTRQQVQAAQIDEMLAQTLANSEEMVAKIRGDRLIEADTLALTAQQEADAALQQSEAAAAEAALKAEAQALASAKSEAEAQAIRKAAEDARIAAAKKAADEAAKRQAELQAAQQLAAQKAAEQKAADQAAAAAAKQNSRKSRAS